MTTTLRVTTENQWFQRAEVVKRNRKKRRAHGMFFVEDVRSINQLRLGGWDVAALLFSADKRLSGWAEDVLAEVTAEYHLELTPELMGRLSDKEDTSELIALVKISELNLDRVPVTDNPLLVLLDRTGNPGNLGSIIRSSDAFGVDGVVTVGHSADLFDPVAVRASAGAFFSMPLAEGPSDLPSLEIWFQSLKERAPGLMIIGTSAKAPKPLHEAPLDGPALLCFGNETLGLSRALKDQCDLLVNIEMGGVASSLNLACAASVTLYEAHRQRR
ncbi:MAG: RNA methyltransferase [bacterium]|nr:RNA methyltransferase [bacterium]